MSEAAESLCAWSGSMLEETVFDQDGLTGTWYEPLGAEWAEGPHTVQS